MNAGVLQPGPPEQLLDTRGLRPPTTSCSRSTPAVPGLEREHGAARTRRRLDGSIDLDGRALPDGTAAAQEDS
jgi:hypothetical protein